MYNIYAWEVRVFINMRTEQQSYRKLRYTGREGSRCEE